MPPITECHIRCRRRRPGLSPHFRLRCILGAGLDVSDQRWKATWAPPAERRNHEHNIPAKASQAPHDLQDLHGGNRRIGGRGPGGRRLQRLLPHALPALGLGDPGGIRNSAGQEADLPRPDHRTDRMDGEPSGAAPGRRLPRLGPPFLRPRAERGRRHARVHPPPALAIGHDHRLPPRRRLRLHGRMAPFPPGRHPGPQDRGRRPHAALPAGAPPHVAGGAPARSQPVSAHTLRESG